MNLNVRTILVGIVLFVFICLTMLDSILRVGIIFDLPFHDFTSRRIRKEPYSLESLSQELIPGLPWSKREVAQAFLTIEKENPIYNSIGQAFLNLKDGLKTKSKILGMFIRFLQLDDLEEKELKDFFIHNKKVFTLSHIINFKNVIIRDKQAKNIIPEEDIQGLTLSITDINSALEFEGIGEDRQANWHVEDAAENLFNFLENSFDNLDSALKQKIKGRTAWKDLEYIGDFYEIDLIFLVANAIREHRVRGLAKTFYNYLKAIEEELVRFED